MSHSPASEAELADLVARAAADGRALGIRGGGSRAGFGEPVDGEPLETRGLDGITLYEPGALTLVVKSGTRLSTVEAALAEEGQMLPFEPLRLGRFYGRDDDKSTIGGVVATNASGPRRIVAGACRDSLIGVRFVDGRGRAIKNGGRVMKNVTGYDLVKLMCGTHGTLGVLSEVSLKLLPAPVATATLVLEGLPLDRAIAAMSAALGSPFNVTGAAHLPAGTGSAGTGGGDAPAATLLRIEGLATSVDYRAGALAKLLEEFGTATVESSILAEEGGPADRWRAVRDLAPLWRSEVESDAGGGGEGGSGADASDAASDEVWRLSVRPRDAIRVADALPEASFMFDWGGGLVHARTSAGFDLRAAVSGISGHATLLRATPARRRSSRVFQPEAPGIEAISAGLRREFDPAGILNPGRMGPAR